MMVINYLDLHDHAKAGDPSVHNLHYWKIQGKHDGGAKRRQEAKVILSLALSRQHIPARRLLECEEPRADRQANNGVDIRESQRGSD